MSTSALSNYLSDKHYVTKDTDLVLIGKPTIIKQWASKSKELPLFKEALID
jgi:hypothetical protein